MVRISMQMACKCEDEPSPMDILIEDGEPQMWDGGYEEKGFLPGRRYVWCCTICGHIVCLNLNLLDGEDE